jgi:hypothetical protein
MRKYIFLSFLVFFTMSCEDFLDTKDLTNKSSGNFPKNYNDCNQSLAAVYSALTWGYVSPFYIGALASDEGFGAGAANDYTCHGFDRLRVATPNMAVDLWNYYYSGIFRVNKLIESLDNVTFSSEEQKKSVLGESYFIRAYFFSELSKVFGEVPLVISAAKPLNLPKSPAEDTYAQIASDLKMAIENLPAIPYASINSDRFGHGTKWAAESLMARVFLFYTGYYAKTELPLKEGGAVTKEQVIAYLNDVIDNSGHELISDYRNLWPYTTAEIKNDYRYVKGKGLNWAGDNNIETVFAIKFGWVNAYGEPSNTPCLFFGIRGQTKLQNVFPYGDGYGQAAVNPKFVNQWLTEEPNDTIRCWGSVIDVLNKREGFRKYEIAGWNMVEETLLFQKKYNFIHVYTDKTDADSAKWKLTLNYVFLEQTKRAWESLQDLVMIRFSDVLLMQSELTATADGINKVRARAGLTPVGYTFENLQKERRYEFAFEGIRYFDLLRWYGKEAGVVIDQNQNDADVLNDKVPGKYNADLSERIRATGGFFQIPENEISLSNGILLQNEGWSGPSANL